jgi:hypothetical protein
MPASPVRSRYCLARVARSILDLDRWKHRLPELASRYGARPPFPHIVLDDFLAPSAADAMRDEFPAVRDGTWIHWEHVNERKLGRRDRAAFRPTLAAAIDELSAPPFVAFLESLTGIQGLIADPSLEGGGLHQSERGGFLNVHADFTVHPHHRRWRRRVNVLLYLNKDWPDAWGGHLELWDQAVRHAVRSIAPLHNRVVIFDTDPHSFHGHPTPLACPAGETRKSLALYYFTREASPVAVRSTTYRARPGDGARAALIYGDTLALRLYDQLKRRFNWNDQLISRVLGALRRVRRK